MIRLAVAIAVLAFPASAVAAKKPSKIYLFHVTHVDATAEVKLAEGGTATTKIDLDLASKGWRGRRNAGFWGSPPGWGTLSAPLRTETWTITRPWREERYTEEGEMYVEESTCTKTGTVKDRKIRGSFTRVKGKDVLSLSLPAPPFKLPCATEIDWPGADTLDDVRVPIGRTQMSRKRTTIAFDATETRGEATITWKGELSVEQGYSCTTPPDYPCHTMLM